MRVETKYNIADEIYFLKKQTFNESDLLTTYTYEVETMYVTEITVEVSGEDEDDVIITYRDYYPYCEDHNFVDEDQVFDTKKEALAEADRKNKLKT